VKHRCWPRRWFCLFREHLYVYRLVLDGPRIYKGEVCDRCGKIGEIIYEFK
jgi:hypothetical protein